MHDNELLRRSLLQDIVLLVAHAATFPDLQAVCNTPLQKIRRSARYKVHAPLRRHVHLLTIRSWPHLRGNSSKEVVAAAMFSTVRPGRSRPCQCSVQKLEKEVLHREKGGWHFRNASHSERRSHTGQLCVIKVGHG